MSNLFLNPADHFGKNIVFHGKPVEKFSSESMDEKFLFAPPKTWCFWIDKHANHPNMVK